MPISKKQKQILAFPYTKYDALISDGAIRSGKTVFMMIGFVDWAMREFNHQRFGICGKTVDSATKNIIDPYIPLTYVKRKYKIKWKRVEKIMIVSDGHRENVFEVFGGKDESSFMLIQGRTLAGVLLDEVALMPQSFVEQALARCSVEGSRFWFNCNPDSPEHWFYKNWICKLEKHNALRLHFRLEDNPSLSEKKIAQYKSNYEGVFYRRYIEGEWCVAEGLVYQFDREKSVVNEIPEDFLKYGTWYISIDYGTLNPFSAGLWVVYDGNAIRAQEYYYSGRDEGYQLTDEEYYQQVKALAGNHCIHSIVVDPSAASFITTIRRHGEFRPKKARNEVIPGISLTATLLKAGIIKIHSSCEDVIREFGLYRWDEDSTEDTVIKENDHAMDETRYFCSTIMRRDPYVKQRLGDFGDD